MSICEACHRQIRRASDDLEGTFHRALSPTPNAAYLADLDGNVALRTLWSNDPRPIRRGLQALVAGEPVGDGQWEPTLVPMLRGMGSAYRTLERAGRQAKRDFFRTMPGIYGMARLASLFTPLPSLGRGMAAMALPAAGLVAASTAAWRLTRGRRR